MSEAFLLIVALSLIGGACYAISNGVRKRLVRKGKSNADGMATLTFVLSYMVFLSILAAVLFLNVALER